MAPEATSPSTKPSRRSRTESLTRRRYECGARGKCQWALTSQASVPWRSPNRRRYRRDGADDRARGAGVGKDHGGQGAAFGASQPRHCRLGRLHARCRCARREGREALAGPLGRLSATRPIDHRHAGPGPHGLARGLHAPSSRAGPPLGGSFSTATTTSGAGGLPAARRRRWRAHWPTHVSTADFTCPLSTPPVDPSTKSHASWRRLP